MIDTPLSSENVSFPKVISPYGNPVWLQITSPSGSTNPIGLNWSLTMTQDDIGQTWRENDAFIFEGIRFEAHVTPTKPTHFICEATGTTGMEASCLGLVNAFNNHYKFRGRYFASTYETATPDQWVVRIISLRPGAVFNAEYSLTRLVSGVPGNNNLFTDPYVVQDGEGPTQGENYDGYGTFCEVWAQNTWKYNAGLFLYDTSIPGQNSTFLAALDQNYRNGGQYEFDISNILATLHPDWRPELNFTPRVFTFGGGTTPGWAGAIEAYYIKAGQYFEENGFRQKAIEIESDPLFSWRGAIKAANATDVEFRRTTGLGLPNGRQQELLSSLFNPIGRDRFLQSTSTFANISRSQPISYLSFLHTRLAFQQGKEVCLTVDYTWLDPDGVVVRYPSAIVYGGQPNPHPSDPQTCQADIYYTRIDWNRIKYHYESVLAEYYAPGTTEEEYPLLKAEFSYSYCDSTVYRITERATVVYGDEGCDDEYQPTLVFRNHWGAFEAVQMRAGFLNEIGRETLEWSRGLTKASNYKDIVDLFVVNDTSTTFTMTSKNLNALESEWLKELASSDRVYLYYNGPDYSIVSLGAVRPPQVEQLIPLSVSDAKMVFDTASNSNVLQIQARFSNPEKPWAMPLTDQERIRLQQGTGGGGGTGIETGGDDS